MKKSTYAAFGILLTLCFYYSSVLAKDRIKVTFVNPSRIGSAFWDTTTAIMKAAAEDLNIDLKVL